MFAVHTLYWIYKNKKKHYILALVHKMDSLYLTVTLSNLGRFQVFALPKFEINVKNKAYLLIILTVSCNDVINASYSKYEELPRFHGSQCITWD